MSSRFSSAEKEAPMYAVVSKKVRASYFGTRSASLAGATPGWARLPRTTRTASGWFRFIVGVPFRWDEQIERGGALLFCSFMEGFGRKIECDFQRTVSAVDEICGSRSGLVVGARPAALPDVTRHGVP